MQYPCGFSAQSSLNGACSVHNQTGKAISTCSRAYDFKISPASKISKQKACTNVPIQCKFCSNIHWKNDTLLGKAMRPQELNEFHEKITITNEEENRLKIPESKQGWSTVIYTDISRQTSFVPASLEPFTPISLLIPPRLNYTSGMHGKDVFS
ncbi:hypothetical protein L208DRAFT_1388451 [Tricholoma matsutake]|nr:hypothetical protein L208DRAFT_1388451 [Tricholoma matsutake 945]